MPENTEPNAQGGDKLPSLEESLQSFEVDPAQEAELKALLERTQGAEERPKNHAPLPPEMSESISSQAKAIPSKIMDASWMENYPMPENDMLKVSNTDIQRYMECLTLDVTPSLEIRLKLANVIVTIEQVSNWEIEEYLLSAIRKVTDESTIKQAALLQYGALALQLRQFGSVKFSKIESVDQLLERVDQFRKVPYPRWMAMFLALRVANIKFRLMAELFVRERESDFFEKASQP